MRLSKSYIYFIIVILIIAKMADVSFAQNDSTLIADPDPQRFEKSIRIFDQWDKKNTYPRNAILFVGSSSIRFWETNTFFPNYPVINRGFGGSHISDVNYYFDSVVKRYIPKIIVFYAGDNDIAYEKSVKKVVADFKSFVNTVESTLRGTQIIYISIKPSWSRWQYWSKMDTVNKKIKEFAEINKNLDFVDIASPLFGVDGQPDASYFVNDSLHLNTRGYQIWTELLTPVLDKTYHSD